MVSYKDILLYTISIVFCLTCGFVSSTAMTPESSLWYIFLTKSPLNPPDWVFMPVWTILYVLMGITLALIIKNRQSPFFFIAIALFILQLVLNVLWTFIFFGKMMPIYAYIEIMLLDAVVLILIPVLGKVSRLAQLLTIPYVIWIGFATYLTWFIAFNN